MFWLFLFIISCFYALSFLCIILLGIFLIFGYLFLPKTFGTLLPFEYRNVRFRYLIEQYHNDYETAIKNEKTNVALKILSLIHERGGRFLTASEDGWIEVEEVSAREKIASCFRSSRKVKYPSRYKKNRISGPPPRPQFW